MATTSTDNTEEVVERIKETVQWIESIREEATDLNAFEDSDMAAESAAILYKCLDTMKVELIKVAEKFNQNGLVRFIKQTMSNQVVR